jgi:hypothetical protein
MDAESLSRLILARCGDALDEATTGDLTARLEGAVVPITVFDHVLEVLVAFEERLARLEERAPADNRLRFSDPEATRRT